jgi:hypothetical protein
MLTAKNPPRWKAIIAPLFVPYACNEAVLVPEPVFWLALK